MAANKIRGVRCGIGWTRESVRLTRAHNDANVLSLGARLIDPGELEPLVRLFLETPFEEGRHSVRLAKIAGLGSVV